MYRILGADGKPYGPASADVVRGWIADRRLNARSLAHVEGDAEWRPLEQFPEFASALAQAAPPPPASFSDDDPAPPPRTNTMAIASLVTGAVSFPLQACCCVPVFSALGVAFAIVALTQIRNTPGQGGRAMAWTGLALSAAGLVLFGILLLVGAMGDRWQRIFQ